MGDYSPTARYLHWGVAGLIILQFVLAELAESAEEAGETLAQLALTANHKSVGMTVLMLAVVRLGWRLTHPVPGYPKTMSAWQQRAAHWAHWLLYGLIFVLPVTGWLMSSASAYSVSWFNLFSFPDLVGANPALKENLEAVHETLAQILFVLAVGHIGAGLWHHFKDKDEVLRRISSPGSLVLGVVLVAAGLFFLTVPSSCDNSDPQCRSGFSRDSIGTEVLPVPQDNQRAAASSLPLWSVDVDASSISFTAEQAGASFEGRFLSWQPEIRFDADSLEESSAIVTIDLSSVDTKDAKRDETLATDEWFGGGKAVFRATMFEQPDDSPYVATDATLDFGRGAVSVPFEFVIEEAGGQTELRGSARLDRLALGVGAGDWLDTTWVGQFVDVTVIVVAVTGSD